MLIPHWSKNRDEIVSKIRSRNEKLKIILKTKDDGVGVESWVAHHLSIVRPEALLICDNGSRDEVTLQVYKNCMNIGVQVFEFSGFHNFLHQPKAYPHLHEAVRSSSSYYTIIDTDERMCIISDDGNMFGHNIVDFLEDAGGVEAVPSIWLVGASGSHTIFEGITEPGLLWGLRWGKPVLSSQAEMTGTLLHNNEVPFEYYTEDIAPRVILRHYMKLSPEQRIKANKAKLVARGAVDDLASVEDILELETKSTEDATIRRLVREIRELTETFIPVRAPSSGCIELIDGQVRYFSDNERAAMKRLLQKGPEGMIRQAFPIEDAKGS